MASPLFLFTLVVLASGVSVLQYFRGRRINLHLVRYTSRVLEEVIKPRDKTYQIVGLYVGYHAVLWIGYKSLSRLEATVLLLPRYSAFYYPLSRLTSRFDRVYLRYWYNTYLGGEAHLVKDGAYRRSLVRVIRGFEEMTVKRLEVGGEGYTLAYRDENSAEKLLELAKTLSRVADVKHLAVVPIETGTKPARLYGTLYVYARLEPEKFRDLVRESYEYARSLAV